MRTNEEIINLIIEICSEKEISISELARRVGMAKSAISRYFSKSRQFPLNRISVFADVLNVTPEYLLGLDGSSNNVEKSKNLSSINMLSDDDIEQKKIFANNLLHYLSISGKTQKEVAKSINVSPQTFNTWIQCIALPRMGKIQALADYFNINKTDLLDKHVNIKTIDTTHIIETYTQLTPHRQEIVLNCAKTQLEEQEKENSDIISEDTDNYNSDNIIPLVTYPFLLNAANAGYGVGDEYQYIEGMQVPKKNNADFIMKVSGDSMHPTFEDGDYVYVQKTTDLCYGNIGIFLINNTYYIKEYTKNKLVSHNKNYNDIIPDEFNDIFTIGKVLGKVEN